MKTQSRTEERSLDPRDWRGLRELGHRMVDEMLGVLETVREQPVYRPIPDAVRASYAEPVPSGPTPAEAVYEEFRRTILPYHHGNVHPRFWGWVVGTGTPLGMLAEMLAAGINSNSGFGDHCTVNLERQVLDWMRDALGFGGEGGVFTSGCTAANLTGLAIARGERAGFDVAKEGVGASEQRLLVYGSRETHSSNHRALELLGLGRDAFREVGVDDRHRILPSELAVRIAADRAAGHRPIAVIGNAGTVNCGAFDDLVALADVCEEHGLWLHVDGAFGALVALSPELRHLVAGVERADSLAFDLHKWMHVPYDAAIVLVRDAGAQARTFAMGGAYLSPFTSGLATGPVNFMQNGIQMSRGFRALKAWMTIKEHGTERLGEAILQNVRQAQYLAARVDEEPELERCGPAELNIVCFRYAGGVPEPVRDALNRRILRELHESGEAAPSHTTLEGRFWIRTAIANHRSRREDFDALVDLVLRHGRAFSGEASAARA